MSDGPAIERIGQIAIPVADLERAVVFYSEVLGLRLLFRAPPGLALFLPIPSRGFPTMSSGWRSAATRRTTCWRS